MTSSDIVASAGESSWWLRDVILGTVLIGVALSLIAIMLLWCNRIIARITKRRLKSARDIAKDLKNGA